MLKGKPNPHGGWFVPPQPWEEVARFASYSCQMDTLNLKPWEAPPVNLGDRVADDVFDLRGFGQARKLLDKMTAAGISKYHPDPLKALAEAKP
jgi:hypothetical protein